MLEAKSILKFLPFHFAKWLSLGEYHPHLPPSKLLAQSIFFALLKPAKLHTKFAESWL